MNHDHVDDDRRPCARGTRCVSATIVREDGHTLRRPALGYRTFCDADRTALIRAINALPSLYGLAGSMLGDRSKTQHGADARPTGRPAPPLPVNTGMDELMRRAHHVVASWYERVDAVAGGRGYTTAQVGRMNQHVGVQLMAWSLAERSAATTTPAFPALDGGDAGNELLELAARCRGRLGLVGTDIDLPVPCTECGERGCLVRPDGAVGLEDYVTCRSCGHRYEDTPDDPAFTDVMKDVAAWNAARAKKTRANETTSP